MSLSHGGSKHHSLYPQFEEEEPRGPTVRIYCEANPNFFMATHGKECIINLLELECGSFLTSTFISLGSNGSKWIHGVLG